MWGAYGVERVTNEKSDELWGLTPKETAGWVPGDGAPESCPQRKLPYLSSLLAGLWL